MRVLYLSPFGAFGGATRSLVEVLRVMDPRKVDMHAIVARGVAAKGWFPDTVKLTEVKGLTQWDNTRFSHYRRHRWAVLLRELANWPATRTVLREMRAEASFDLVHCNEITLLPAAIMAKRILGVPLVVHVRSLQAESLAPWRTRMVTRALKRHVDAVVAIDQAVAATLDPSLPVEIIYNSMDVPDTVRDVADHDGPLVFGIIGSLSVSKGVLETVEACAELRRRGVPFRLLIAGENVRELRGIVGGALSLANLSRDIAGEIRGLVAAYGLEEHVEMLGFVRDVESVYGRLDVLCFPSRLDAPGRPVFEAALYGVPAIVAMKGSITDIIEDGVTGLRIDRSDPIRLADAMQAMHGDRARTTAMGRTARARARDRFDSRVAARKAMALYQRVVAGSPR